MAIFFLWSCKDRPGPGTSNLKNTGSERFDNASIPQDSVSVSFDLDRIRERGSIRIILINIPTGYYIYKGRPMGFQYELSRDFCERNELQMEILIENDFGNSFQMLFNGNADIIAHSLTITGNRNKVLAFMNPQYEVKQMLVQPKPAGWKKMKKHEIERKLIKSPSELIGKEIHVKKGSSYVDRLRNLSEEIGGNILVREVNGEILTEDLIEKVSSGEISLTVADEDLAHIGATYYENIDVHTPVSLPTQVSWAVRKYADSINWDWRLLAALIYRESQFNSKARSWMGARGLMQLVPATAKEFGAKDILNPDQNITAGTRYISWLENYWKPYISEHEEMKKFVLASYNTGHGHVMDAMRLAEKYGKDPEKWDNNVEFYMLLKSKPKYFRDPVVQWGYCRGSEPVQYVKSILEQYKKYKQFFY